MSNVRRRVARALDGLAIVVIVFALYHFVVAPRLQSSVVVPAPPIALAQLDGGRFALARHRGRVVFLDFWASWCEPCKQSLPLVEHYARTHPDVDVAAVDVAENVATAAVFARAHQVRNVVLDPDEIAAHAYGVEVFPTMVVVDPAGTIRAKWIGYNPAIELAMADASTRYGRRPKADGRFGSTTAAAATLAAVAPPKPPTFVIEDDPNSLDTIRNTPFGWALGPLTQGYLFLVDDRGALVPDRALAVPSLANGGISADGRTITYRIRAGRWSDGRPFDAHDVGFTIDALRNPKTAVPDTSAVAAIASYEIPNAGTLVVHLRTPSAPFVTSFLSEGASDPFSILPRHIAAHYASLDRSSLDTDPVGLGPFRVTQWLRGERLRFERNPYYWRGPARSAVIRVLVEPSPATRLLLARTGEADAVDLPGPLVDAARAFPGIRIAAVTTNIVDYLQLNLRSPVLRNMRARVAIAQAIDRRRLAADVYRSTLVPTDSVQIDPRYRATRRMPAWAPHDRGAAASPPARALDFAIASNWRNSTGAAVAITADLAAAGFSPTIRGYSQAAFWGAKDAGGVLENGRYDLALTSWSPGLDPDRSYLFGCAATPPGGGNSMYFCDRGYDRDEWLGARSYDPRVRATFYRDAANRLVAALPILPLGFERRIYAVNERLLGFRPNVLGRDFWNAWQFATTP